MSEGNPIEQGWDIFARITIPQGASESQRQAMYMAFIAGCDTILQLEETVRDRAASHRVKSAFTTWSAYVKNELRRIGMLKN